MSKGMVPSIFYLYVEGYDFDVLFGASSVLDRNHYLEFEYHEQGNWGKLHIQDAVRLLDGKGFTCYWAGKNKLWRISGCYFELRLFYQAHDVAIHGEMNPFCLYFVLPLLPPDEFGGHPTKSVHSFCSP